MTAPRSTFAAATLVVAAAGLATIPAHADTTPPANIECHTFEAIVPLLLSHSGGTYAHGPYDLYPVTANARTTPIDDGKNKSRLPVKILVSTFADSTDGGVATVVKSAKKTTDATIHTLGCSFIKSGSSYMQTKQKVGTTIAASASAPASSTMVLSKDNAWQGDHVFLTVAWGDPKGSGSNTWVQMLFQK